MQIATAAERPDLDARGDALSAEIWPEYNRHGDVMTEHWARLDDEFREFPDSGEHWFPQGLAPLRVDRERDEGLYFEPNVWMRHAASK